MTWRIDLAASTATHASGLVILFEPAADADGAWDGRVTSDIPPTFRRRLRSTRRRSRV